MASVTDYRDALIALLPQGDAWPREPDSDLGLLMQGIAEEFARIDARAIDLLNESHPSQAYEMFDEWEAMYGLPDSCSSDDQSFPERRAAVVRAYKEFGGQSRAFFIAVAAALGYTITITEYQARSFGSELGTVFGGDDWNFTWQVNAAAVNPQTRSFGEPMGELFASWGNARLECVFNRLRHAHRHIIFSYT